MLISVLFIHLQFLVKDVPVCIFSYTCKNSSRVETWSEISGLYKWKQHYHCHLHYTPPWKRGVHFMLVKKNEAKEATCHDGIITAWHKTQILISNLCARITVGDHHRQAGRSWSPKVSLQNSGFQWRCFTFENIARALDF